MFIERMYDYNRATDMYEHTETWHLTGGDGTHELCSAIFCLGLKMGRAGVKNVKDFDLDAGYAVVGCECTGKNGLPEYWAVRK